jgi:hypothetical protein
VSYTCVEGSSTQCVSVEGDYLVSPAAFKTATVVEAIASERNGQNIVTM